MLDNRKNVGSIGETKACEYLAKAGYTVLCRNYRTNRGEIDIIALKGKFIVFVEVKTLPSGNLDLLSHVLNTTKQKRIIKTSKRFLLNYRQYSNNYVRYDVIVLDMPGFPPVYHIENAFAEFL